MREEIKIKEAPEDGHMPILSLSVANLEIRALEGRVYRDSFVIESENKVPIRGFVVSTNDKLDTEIHEFQGVRQEIPFYFKGKLSVAGTEHDGDIVLITNGGEFNIPYHIQVVARSAESSVGDISDMEGFMHLYRENRAEAVSLFFLPEFAEVFLKNKPEEQVLYHGLQKSRSRNLIVEEFLTAAGYKAVSLLEVSDRPMVLDVGREQESLEISLSDYGYVEGRISSRKGLVALSTDRFNSDYFEDGKLKVIVEKNPRHPMGSDTILIETIRQSIEIPVEWWGTLPAGGPAREEESRIRRQKAELMHNYLYFRTGSIGFEDFIEGSGKGAENLYRETEDPFWKMYRAHIYLMDSQLEAAGRILDEMAPLSEAGDLPDLLVNYGLYLQAMYKKTPEAISKAVVSIRKFYENSDQKDYALWMLIYLDREYVYNKILQYETIKMLFEGGSNNCLLYYEACEILNENPNYMKELGTFEINVFRWGLRYGCVSLPLSYQFARLAMNCKFFSRAIFHTAIRLYEVEEDDLFLQLICSQLIKGNRIGGDYHEYFRRAVEANLKIIGLNEFFIRSMDFGKYEIIPRRVLIYFTYSNSLDYREKSWLYANVMKHREEYEEVYGAYYSRMLPFVQEQLLQGRINEHLAFLYMHFQKEILAQPENWKAVCGILFYRKIICRNPHMVGVYVESPENGEEKYYPFSGGQAVIETFNSRTSLYFADKSEQRYVKEIEYELRDYLSFSDFPGEWIRKNLVNRKVLLVQSECLERKTAAEDVPVLERILEEPEYKDWIRIQAAQKLLTWHENHQNKEELAHWLERMDYSDISPSFRKTLMDYYMEVGMIEKAFFGVELYGCTIMGAEKRMKLAEFGIDHYKGEEDETTLYLAYTAFMRRKNSRKTLTYLMNHFQGETEDLLTLWERSRKFELPTTDFERRILIQSVFADNDTDGVFPVYQSFYESSPEDEMVGRYLEYVLNKEMRGSMTMPDDMHRILGEQILSGRISSRSSKINFLYYFADKPEWHERIQEPATQIIREFTAQAFYLPVFRQYEDFVSLPIECEELHFVTYKGSPGSRVIFHYEIEGEENTYRDLGLMEILPGTFVGSLHLFHRDEVHYRLEEDGRDIDEQDAVLFESFDYSGEDSRFARLNHLASEDADPMELDDYLLKAYFADTQLELL